jgi:putative ABC transport system ATP-binding protein
MTEQPVVVADRVSKTYTPGNVAVHALRDVSFTIDRGDFVAIMGSSGSGKSTLMNIVGCLDVPTRGRYLLDGVDVRLMDESDLALVRNRKLGFVFQSFNLIPRTSTIRNVELPLVYAGLKPKERRARALEALRTVGLENRMEHLPSELSGGQQQRAAIARSLVTDPAILLADEPTGNLDSVRSHEVMELLRAFNRRKGITIRKPIDCMIASVYIEHGIALLHNDRDFDPIETHCGLKVVKTLKNPTKPSRRRPDGRS